MVIQVVVSGIYNLLHHDALRPSTPKSDKEAAGGCFFFSL